MKKIRLTETELTDLIENTINEELLLEKRVCGWWLRDGGSRCENRRRQQAWNCGGDWEDVSPNDDWGCADFASVVPGSDGSDGSEVWGDERLSERHIRRILRKL